MALERLGHRESLGINEVDVVVVRADSEGLSVRRVMHGFDPLGVFGLCKQSLLHLVETSWQPCVNSFPVNLSDGHDAGVVCNCKLVEFGIVCHTS